MRFARGDAFTRAASAGATAGTVTEGTAPRSPLPETDAGAGRGAGAGVAPTASPGATMTAISLPPGTGGPSPHDTFHRIPPPPVRRSRLALAVSPDGPL